MQSFLFFLISTLLCAWQLVAEPTRIAVRVLGKDSKFVGSSVGGAQIVIRSVMDNKVLASGITLGSTGDTNLLIKKKHERYLKLASNKSAVFRTAVDLLEPTLVKISARGPLEVKTPQETSITLWLFPGKHLDTHNGIILELPGIAIWPRALIAPAKVGQPVNLIAEIKMMCGCPISPTGLWDSNAMDLWGEVRHDGKVILKSPLIFSKGSEFMLTFIPEKSGRYEVIFMAFDKRSANSGLEKLSFVVD